MAVASPNGIGDEFDDQILGVRFNVGRRSIATESTERRRAHVNAVSNENIVWAVGAAVRQTRTKYGVWKASINNRNAHIIPAKLLCTCATRFLLTTKLLRPYFILVLISM